MAIRRPLVLDGGQQKQIRDADLLDVGSGIEARNWKSDGSYETVTLQIGSSANTVVADNNGAYDPLASKPIQFMGGVKFDRDVLIDGELRVKGGAFSTDTMVTQTIFNENVVFGDEATDVVQVIGKADFDGSIDGDVTDYDMQSSGAAKLQAGTNLDLDGATVNLDSADSLDILAVGAASLGAASMDETIVGAKSLVADSLAETLAGAHTMSALSSVETLGGKTITTSNQPIVLTAASTGLDFDGGVVNADASGAMHLGAGANSEWIVTGQLDLTPSVKLVATSPDIQLVGAMDFDGTIDHDGASFDSHVTGQFKAKADVDVLLDAPLLDLDGALDHDGASFDSLVSGAWKAESSAGTFTAKSNGQMTLESANGLTAKSGAVDGRHLVLMSNGGAPGGAFSSSQSATGQDIIASARQDLLMEAGGHAKMAAPTGILLDSEGTLDLQAAGAVVMDFESTFQIDAEGDFNFDAKDMDIDAVGDINIDATVDNVAKDGGDIRIAANYDALEALGGQIDLLAGQAFNASSGNNQAMLLTASGNLSGGSVNGDVLFTADTDNAANARLQLYKAAASRLTANDGQDLHLGANGQNDLVLKSAGNFELRVDNAGDPVHQIKEVKDPTDDQDAVTKKYMEENGGGTAKLTIAAAEVATMAVGDLVSLNSSGEVIQASGKSTQAASGRHYAIGFVTKIENSNEALVRMLGKYELPAAHSVPAGQPIYMTDDVFVNATGGAGKISATAPSGEGDMVQRVGFSLGGSLLLVAIGEPVIL